MGAGMSRYDSTGARRVADSNISCLTDYVEVALASTPLPQGECRVILCSADGALNLTNAAGVVRENVPVQKGYNPLVASAIDDPTTGSAPGSVFACY